MGLDTRQGFRFAYLAGLIAFYFSLFVEWYLLRVVNAGGELIASWGYDFINGFTYSLSGVPSRLLVGFLND